MKKSIKGFTLIEVMIVVAILGIIAAIAIPAYDRYIVRTKRADGMAALLNAANAMERHRAVNFGYQGAAVGTTFEGNVPAIDPYYQLSIDQLTATTYRITATPINSMLGRDGILRINHQGIRYWEDKDGNPNNCWPESGDSC